MTRTSVETPQPPVFQQALRYNATAPDMAVYSTTTGEATAAPGLVIVPEMTRRMLLPVWRFTGEWQLRHASSGLRVMPPVDGAGLGHVRDAAALLGEDGFDWTLPVEHIAASGSPYRERSVDIHRRMRSAAAHGCPLRTTATSWRVCPPLWDVVGPDGSEAAFDRYEHAADFLTRCQIPGCIVRDEHPAWQLHCSWTECHEALIDGEYELTLRVPDRAVLTEQAHEAGWRRLDERRWLCRDCSPLFTPTASLL